MKKITKVFWYVVLHFTVFAAVALSLIRIAMPYAENYLTTIEQWAESQLHIDIKIDSLDSGWHGFGPALRFKDVTLSDETTQKQIATIQYVDIQLDVLASLLKWDLVLGKLTIEGLVGTLRTDEGPQGVALIPVGLLQAFKRITVKNTKIIWPMSEGKPVILNIADFSVRPEKEKQRVELRMRLANTQSRLQFIVDTQGNWMKPETMKINGYARLKNVPFDPRYMPREWQNLIWQEGLLNGDVWFDYDQGSWKKVIGHVDLDNVVLKNANTQKTLPFSFAGNVALEEKAPEHFLLTADDVSFTVHEKLSALKSWVIEMDPQEPWEAKFNAISLFDAISIARILGYLDADTEKKVKLHDPHARLYDIEWFGTPGNPDTWHLGFQVSDAYEKSEGNLPGIDNLSGTVKITPKEGEFTVDSQNLTLVVPTAYPHALEIDSAKGLITWTHAPLEIKTTQFELKDEDAIALVDLSLAFPADKPAHIKLGVDTNELKRETVLYYLPGKALGASLFHWISNAFVEGRVAKATAKVDGALKDFPYENGKGIFELQFALRDGVLNYKEHWPLIKGLNAQLVIDGKKFQSYIDSGYFQTTHIKQAVAAVDYSDKKKPLILTISGDIIGPADDTENFLKQSPLWTTMGTGMEWVDIIGTLKTRLDLKIPLDDKTKADTAGIVSMQKGIITLPAWNMAFNDVTGSVSFKNGCITGKNVNASFQKRPATLNVTCKETEGKRYHDWVLKSIFNVQDVKNYLSPVINQLISGSSPYSATLSTISGQGESTLTLRSDLKGVTIQAPDPVGKVAKTVKSLAIRLMLKSETELTPVITYDGLFSAGLLFKKENKNFLFKGMNLILGKEAAIPPTKEGFNISGKINTLQVDSWLTFFEKLKTPGEKPMNISGGFWVDTLLYKGFRLQETFLSWKRLASQWEVSLDGPGAKGLVTVPDTISVSNPITLQFDRYVWRPQPGSDNSPDLNPSSVSPINFNCTQCFYGEQLMGNVVLKIRPIQNGVSFDPITITSDIHQISAKGTWTKTKGGSVSAFQGEGKTKNITQTLAASGVKTDIVDAKGDAKFDVRWPGSPGKFSKATVAGNVDMSLTKGRLVDVNPGLGRLFGLFSVESLQRRLQFDFSDLFEKGFSFDIFEAKININKGTAYTKDATMKAPAANMILSGKVGLVNQSLDMLLDVKSTASSTVSTVGAAAIGIANPIAGIAMWLAGKMFNPLDALGHYRYHITGTWQKPVFTDVSNEIKEKEKAPVQEAK